MELIPGTEEFKNSFIETYKNPFMSDKVQTIWFYIRKDPFGDKIIYEAWAEFKNGDTQGKHTIKGDDFPSLIIKMEAFIKGLEKPET